MKRRKYWRVAGCVVVASAGMLAACSPVRYPISVGPGSAEVAAKSVLAKSPGELPGEKLVVDVWPAGKMPGTAFIDGAIVLVIGER